MELREGNLNAGEKMPTLGRQGTVLNTGDITQDITSTSVCFHRTYVLGRKEKANIVSR